MRGQISTTATESHEFYEKRSSQKLSNQIQHVLENENLVRKEVSEEQDSLFRAFSEGLYFTPNYYQQIKDLLIRNLSNLITTNTIPPKLGIFRGNSVLWNDYSKNPSSPEFFIIRVVVYDVTTDGILNAKIFNNKFDKTVQYLNLQGVHLDVVYNKDAMQTIGSCQSSQQIERKDFSKKEKCDTVLNFFQDFSKNEPKLQESKKELKFEGGNSKKKVKTQHKKSKSDSDLKCIQEDHLQRYNMFVNSKSSEEFAHLIEKDLSKLGQSPDISLIQEPRLSLGERSSTSEGQQQQQASLGLGQVRSFPNEKRVILEEEEEDLPSPDMIKFEKSKSYIDPTQLQQKSASNFGNIAPPGLTPNRYNTKTYGTENFTQATSTADTQPIKQRLSESHSQNVSGDLSQQQNGSQSTAQTRSRAGSKTLNLSTHSEEFGKLLLNGGTPIQNLGLDANPQLTRAQSQRVSGSEKKKPVIIDESQHRYTGKLKFFDEGKNYGFIVMDDDGSDIFVHYDDLHKANMNKEFLKSSRLG